MGRNVVVDIDAGDVEKMQRRIALTEQRKIANDDRQAIERRLRELRKPYLSAAESSERDTLRARVRSMMDGKSPAVVGMHELWNSTFVNVARDYLDPEQFAMLREMTVEILGRGKM